MNLRVLTFFLSLLHLSIQGCPTNFPLPSREYCYRFETASFNFKDAENNCKNLGGRIISVKDPELLQKLTEKVVDYIDDKTGNSAFWIGFKTQDDDLLKKEEERIWSFDYDKEEVIQKNYQFWDNPPNDKALQCAAVTGSSNFNVIGVDCGGPRIPVLCMKDGECREDNKPFLWYKDYCLASINAPMDYGKIFGACSPGSPAPIKDREMKKFVTLAAKNSFVGGAVFQNYFKWFGNRFLDKDDNTMPDDDMWEQGEPRDYYDCVGLALQADGSLKLRTLGCDFMSASLCIHAAEKKIFVNKIPNL